MISEYLLLICFASTALVTAQECKCEIYGTGTIYDTYDGNSITVSEEGKYIMAMNKPGFGKKFSVIGQMKANPHVSWTVGVQFKYGGYKLKMDRFGKLKVNKVIESVTWNTPSSFLPRFIKVEHINNWYLRVTTDFGLDLARRYSGRHSVITLPDTYRGDDKLCGICGSCNDNPDDDLNTRDGNPTTGNMTDRHSAVGESYVSG